VEDKTQNEDEKQSIEKTLEEIKGRLKQKELKEGAEITSESEISLE